MSTTMRFILLATLLALAACSEDEPTCVDSNDCFAGETCQQGLCAPDDGPTGDMGTTDAGGDSDTPDASPTADASADDAGVEPTDAADDSGTVEASCLVDPFDVEACPDDDNDRFAERFVQPTIGCQNDGYVGLDETRTERLCALEMADRYSVSIIECDDRSQILEVRLTPLVSCPAELFDISVSQGAKSCAEQETTADVQCAWQDDGSYLAQIVVDPGRSITLASIILEQIRDDVDFEYDLQVTLR